MPDEDPRPFDMDAINAAVDAMSPDQRAEALELADKVAADVASGRRYWFDVPVEEAVNIALPREDIIGPVDEEGQPCPWPWEPQQRVGWPMGQYHCSYCGAMVLAGVPHIDYTDGVGVVPSPL